MKQPQKLALKLNEIFPNSKMRAIADYACCCLTLMWYLDLDMSDIDAIITVAGLINKKVNNDICLDDEFTVHWYPLVKALTGRDLESVTEQAITSIKGIKGKAIVKFKNGDKYHWGGVKNGRVVYDSLGSSVTIAQGQPVLIKVLKIKGIK